MTCGHLFNGIGGFALAAHWMGWQNVWHSEIDDFCNKVMAKHFPESQQYGDINDIDFKEMPAVELVTGGFPCQPFSVAGEKRGTEDSRHLWPQMRQAIKVIKPRWVVAENVYGIVNWSDGLVFEQVQTDLEDEGYRVQPYILPAAAVNAPHRRDRVWFVAYSPSGGVENYETVKKRKGHKEAIKHNLKAAAQAMLPTPSKSEQSYRLKGNSQASKCLEAKARRGELNGHSGQLNPPFVEWMMGFPTGWTALKPSATP